MDRAVFLDRDGVLNRSAVRNGRPYAPTSLAELALLPGVVEALTQLREAGFRLIVVTNQPDVGAGKVSVDIVEQINRQLRQELPIDDIKVCYHQDKDQCPCRKPKPGMILAAAKEWSIDLGRSYMVGDRWRDVSAGRAAGCKTIFVDQGYSEPHRDQPDYVVTSLREAARIMCRQEMID